MELRPLRTQRLKLLTIRTEQLGNRRRNLIQRRRRDPRRRRRRRRRRLPDRLPNPTQIRGRRGQRLRCCDQERRHLGLQSPKGETNRGKDLQDRRKKRYAHERGFERDSANVNRPLSSRRIANQNASAAAELSTISMANRSSPPPGSAQRQGAPQRRPAPPWQRAAPIRRQPLMPDFPGAAASAPPLYPPWIGPPLSQKPSPPAGQRPTPSLRRRFAHPGPGSACSPNTRVSPMRGPRWADPGGTRRYPAWPTNRFRPCEWAP